MRGRGGVLMTIRKGDTVSFLPRHGGLAKTGEVKHVMRDSGDGMVAIVYVRNIGGGNKFEHPYYMLRKEDIL
jgi:ATP-dependent Lon protease